MKTLLPPPFFNRPVLTVVEDLLGKVLIRKEGERQIHGVITDVEAYDGPLDQACHGRFGCTKRTAPMFGPAGHWYVYLVYGIHWMLNIVTGPVGYPAAVLIRGIMKPKKVRGRYYVINGPAKLTKALDIGKEFNALPATETSGLWIEDWATKIPKSAIHKTPRIGVDYAGAWAKKPYRFILRNKAITTTDFMV